MTARSRVAGLTLRPASAITISNRISSAVRWLCVRAGARAQPGCDATGRSRQVSGPQDEPRRVCGLNHADFGFWILDFGFWIVENIRRNGIVALIQNPKSKI